jgi:regulator of sirC expression with transglutaminase-like and TPR domain
MERKKKPTEQDVELLLTFLVDRNPSTVSLAKAQLKRLLEDHPHYRQVVERIREPEVAGEARLFLEEDRLERLLSDFRLLAAQGDALDLERGAYLLCTLAFPNLAERDIQDPLDQMATELDGLLDAEETSPTREVTLVRHFIFQEMGFRGNERNYYDPDNSFLNRVLERRVGIPISLSCVYILVSERLDLPVYGIGLPGHFIVAHASGPAPIFIDPFHGGRLLSRADCIELVRQRGIGFQDAFLSPTSPRHILARMMVNLMNVYSEQGATGRAQWLGRVAQILQEEP